MSWLLVLFVCWAAVAAVGAVWLGGAARLVADRGGRPPESSLSDEMAALYR
ncbi:hypothetical protein O2W14_13480 [Modestobacter sp. VKM Ac-2986]|uniref:hypothetical protein n=1 Tax=Modestobacter sp. VKM Ac-2986 TaxID=3004140 RepID=UPI0022AB5CCB|nr:hypothetical protein [Modestobacter sp. VKM Ac-2986]MCZ2829849.1 hypothetical protein [Modestobacter sp. VKM Ac-2986]